MTEPRLSSSIGRTLVTLVATVALCAGGDAEAVPTQAQKCLAAKLKAVGKYDLCVFKAQAVAALKGTSVDTTKCDSKFADKWAKPDLKFGADCPSASSSAIEEEVDEHVQEILDLLGATPATCGNGEIDGAEDCDGSNLSGQTCASQGFASGPLGCSSECEFDTSACVSEPCDALVQDCPAGKGCYSDGGSTPACYDAGIKTEGQACTVINECVPGHLCVQQDTTTKCRQVCEFDGDNEELECPAGQDCSEALVGENAGICF